MTEFGHNYVSGPGFHIDSWGRGPFIIHHEGKVYRFEDSDRFGPALLKKDGELKTHPYPAERSPFWRAFDAWRRQGRRVEADGETCVFELEEELQ